MNQEVKDVWVAKLLEPDRKQTTGFLEVIRNVVPNDQAAKAGQCCLGVLMECAVEAGVIDPPNIVVRGDYEVACFEDNGEESLGSITDAVRKWAGLQDFDPNVRVPLASLPMYNEDDVEDGEEACVGLIELNDDHKFTFPEIAELVKEQL
jgi:hypothetical protein